MKTTFLFSHVEGEVVLKSFEGQVWKTLHWIYKVLFDGSGLGAAWWTKSRAVAQKKANGCAGNHVEKDIKCSQTLMSTGPDS